MNSRHRHFAALAAAVVAALANVAIEDAELPHTLNGGLITSGTSMHGIELAS